MISKKLLFSLGMIVCFQSYAHQKKLTPEERRLLREEIREILDDPDFDSKAMLKEMKDEDTKERLEEERVHLKAVQWQNTMLSDKTIEIPGMRTLGMPIVLSESIVFCH